MSVQFSDQAYRLVEDIADQSGISMGEAIRRAIALYAWYRENRSQGNRILVERPNGSIRELVRLEF